jgi:hypothetical protein
MAESSCLHRVEHDLFQSRFDRDDNDDLPYPVEPILLATIKASNVSPQSRRQAK